MRRVAGAIPPSNRAHLTLAENRVWEKTFSALVSNGVSAAQADEQTWLELQRLFPRLKTFDGCEAGCIAVITQHTLSEIMGRGKRFTVTVGGEQISECNSAKNAERAASRKGITNVTWRTL